MDESRRARFEEPLPWAYAVAANCLRNAERRSSDSGDWPPGWPRSTRLPTPPGPADSWRKR